MSTESDCVEAGLLPPRPGLSPSTSPKCSSQNGAVGPTTVTSEQKDSSDASKSPAELTKVDKPRKLFFPDPKVGVEFSSFSETREKTAVKLERDLIRQDEKWYWEQLREALGKYEDRFMDELLRISPATRITLMQNTQNHPRAQIEDEGYECEAGKRNTGFRALAAESPRAWHYSRHPEDLKERESNAQIWFGNAPPVEIKDPFGGVPWDEQIFSRASAKNPVPVDVIYSDAGDPLPLGCKSLSTKLSLRESMRHALRESAGALVAIKQKTDELAHKEKGDTDDKAMDEITSSLMQMITPRRARLQNAVAPAQGDR